MTRTVSAVILCLIFFISFRDFNVNGSLKSSSNKKSQSIFIGKSLRNESVCLPEKEENRKQEKLTLLSFSKCVATFLVGFAVLSTIYDLKSQEVHRNESFLAFSLYKNSKKLFNFKQESSSDVIQCLNGIRVLSTLSIVLLHSVFYRVFPPVRDELILKSWLGTNTASTISAINITVDSFFVISAALATKSMLRELDL